METNHKFLDVSGSDAMLLQGCHQQRPKLFLLLLVLQVTGIHLHEITEQLQNSLRGINQGATLPVLSLPPLVLDP